MAEHLGPQREQHVVAYEGGRRRLNVLRDSADRRQHYQRDSNGSQPGQIIVCDKALHRDIDQERLCVRRDGGDQHANRGKDRLALVWPQVREQAPHDAVVIHTAELIVIPAVDTALEPAGPLHRRMPGVAPAARGSSPVSHRQLPAASSTAAGPAAGASASSWSLSSRS